MEGASLKTSVYDGGISDFLLLWVIYEYKFIPRRKMKGIEAPRTIYRDIVTDAERPDKFSLLHSQ